MNFQVIGTYILVISLLTIIPGPNTALLIKTVSQNSRRAGLINLAGIVSGFYMHGIFSILGLSAIILKTSHLFFAVKLMGAIYLIYLGLTSLWQAFCSKKSLTETIKCENMKEVKRKNNILFLEGFFTNLLNPKASLFYLAVFPQFINSGGNHVFESFILVMIHSLIVTLWFSFFIIALGKITKALISLKFKKIVQGVTGTLMLWFGYRLLVYHQKN